MANVIDIAALRKNKKKNQSEMAEILGINQSQISEIERGIRPMSEKYEKILVEQFGKEVCDEFRISSQDNRRLTVKGDIKGHARVSQGTNNIGSDCNSENDLQTKLDECSAELAKTKKELEQANKRIDKLLSIIENLSKGNE